MDLVEQKSIPSLSYKLPIDFPKANLTMRRVSVNLIDKDFSNTCIGRWPVYCRKEKDHLLALKDILELLSMKLELEGV